MSQACIMLYLDDLRPTPEGWVRVFTAQECIDFLAQHHVDVLSLDHDLGPAECGTGYDVLRWLEEQCYTNGFKAPTDIRIHSANPVGRANMEAAIASIRRVS